MIPKFNQTDSGPYKVMDKKTGCEVPNAFVLLPENDSAARTALAAYAEATINTSVARFLRDWLHRIHNRRAIGRRVIEKL